MSRRHRRQARGFTLLEILLTVALLAIALIPLALSFRSSSRSVTSTREYLDAVALAQSALEQIRHARYRPVSPDEASSSSTPPPGLETIDEVAARLNGSTHQESPDSPVTFALTVKLLPASASSDPEPTGVLDLKVVQIIVTWQARGGAFAGDQRYELYSAVGGMLRP